MKQKLFLTILLLVFSSINAQKSAPIMGDAATLVDLLKKDYNTVSPDSRDEEINTDRGKVIALFKSYLDNTSKASLTLALPSLHTQLQQQYDTFQKRKETLNSIVKLSMNINNAEVANVSDKLKKIQEELQTAKNDYFKTKYNFDDEELSTLQIAYSNNQYLSYMILQFINKYQKLDARNIDLYAEKNTYSSIQKSIPFIGGDLAFETLIDGLSRFLAKRIKEELTLHAIDKIKKYLENPTPKNYCYELLAVLPTTTNYLKTFQADQLLNFTDELKQYIEQDLNNLLDNAKQLKNTPRIKNYIADNPDLEFAFEGLEIIPQLSKIKSPVDYFEILENSPTLNRWKTDLTNRNKFNIAQSLRFASMLAYSMTIIDNAETKFVSVDFLSNYGNEAHFNYLYFGFLHQQNIKYFNISFVNVSNVQNSLNLATFMSSNPLIANGGSAPIPGSILTTNFLNTHLVPIAKDAEKIYNQGLLLKKRNKNGEEIPYKDVYGFVDDIINFAENTMSVAEELLTTQTLVVIKDFNIKEKLTPYFNVAKIANDMILDLHEKKYSNAVIRAIEIPLNFKNNSSDYDFMNDQLNFSKTLESNADLSAISQLFNKSFDKLSKKEKVSTLKSLNTQLHIVSIKQNSVPGLASFKSDLDNLIISIDALYDNDLTRVNGNIAVLKNTLENPSTKAELLAFADISKAAISMKLEDQLLRNGVDTRQVVSIQNVVDAYFDHLIDKKIFDKTTGAIDYENNMKAVIKEFAPQLIFSNTKIADNKAIKLIHFINDVSNAENAEEVEKSIEAFALPAGSSSLKEKAKYYFSVNSYPGIVVGVEFSQGKDAAQSYGFTAPVGLYGQIWNYKGKTLGIFLPIIDIAASVRLRLDNDSQVKTLPDFNFNDIFSPGIYLTFGFGKSPFALNLGAQYGPKLRDIAVEGEVGSFESIDSYRINLGVVIDIPLFTISGTYNE